VLTLTAPTAPVHASGKADPTAKVDRAVVPGEAIYRRPLTQDPATLDPARIADIFGRSVAHQIFDGLVQFDQTLTIVPGLAKFWRASRDGLTWTFTLRQGVRFHHGREVTADDVVYSFQRLVDPRVRSGAADLFVAIKGARAFREGRASHVAGLAALDRYTVQVTLEEAIQPFVSLAAVGHAKIVPRDVVEQAGDGFGAHPVGTGPFRFVRWERGKEIVLAANPGHFDGRPKVAGVVFRVYAGLRYEAIYEEFKKGLLEDAHVPVRDYHRVIKDPSHVYVRRSMFNVRFYGFNTRRRPFNDVRVRQAVVHALDREGIVNDIFLGRFVPAGGVLPPGSLGFNPRLRTYGYDPQRAAELLRSAGYPNGAGLPPVAISSSVKDERILREHEQITKSLAAVGIKAEFRYVMDWPAFSKMLADSPPPMFLYAWHADVPDPDNFLYNLFSSGSPRNFFGYANRTVDDLLVRARAEQDLSRRVELYRRAEQLIVDDAPIVPMWHYTYERLFQPYVRSVEVNGLGDPYIPLRKIWLEGR
jgi:peptide/nickel transport system substrate-binding protein/oligopeptide transport system substrate-binding protein